MKIAIVAPSPVPFVVGGAEKLWWGMQKYINDFTSHNCELIKIPTPENTLIDIIHSYYRFYTLDITYFDMVISTKYPAFMVQHSNHHLYLQHLLRGLYDTYPKHLAETPTFYDKEVDKLMDKICSADISIDNIFCELMNFIEKRKNDEYLNRFPGPFIRKIVRTLDRRGMENIKTFSCISETVKNRKDYFPPFADVEVIYHPSGFSEYKNNGEKYFFTASRLDKPKRIDLLIQAFMLSDVKIPLIIAGTGPEEENLKKRAQHDDRIKFVGFVSEKELIQYYSDSKAVIFIPYDEDFGLITYEAFASGKPVITCSDSGGVTELVKDGINGFIAEPSPASLAKAINNVDSLLTKDVQNICKSTVKSITWSNLINKLIQKGKGMAPYVREKIICLSTYPVFSPCSGGQLRTFHILKRLSSRYDIILLSLASNCRGNISEVKINMNFKEIKIPESKAFDIRKRTIDAKLGVPATDIAFMLYSDLNDDFSRLFNKYAEEADAVLCVQPYSYPLATKYFKGPIIHESQNVEYFLKKQMVITVDEDIFNKLYSVEREICSKATFNIVCTKEDAAKFVEIYNLDDFKYHLVPNGVDAKNTPFFDRLSRHAYKKKLGIKGSIAIFVGSWHQPNIDAVHKIINMAEAEKSIKFLVIGSVGLYFKDRDISFPKNLSFTGLVSDTEKSIYLRIADIAVNPMLSGSGSNLKVAEYMAAGLPVVSTEIGCRGYGDKITNYADIAEIEEFPGKINYRLKNPDDLRLKKAREYILENYDWDVVIKNFPFV